MGKLDTLNQQVRTCRLCRLCRTRLNGVPGDGNDRAEVLFIGEGPGFHEDREARPFVGPAGQFLDELLDIAGLRRPDVYITNVVKCRPPQNRDPLPDEIDACAPYLERQIATIDPVLIVTLGRFSMGRFFPNDKISSVHGQARQVEGRVVMTMWHPAYGLRDPRGRESLKDDFRKLPAVLEQARALRAERPAPAPRRQPDFSALVEEHLSGLPVAPPPAEAAAPAAEPADAFAYLAAVNGKTRKASGRRNGSAPAEPAPPAVEPEELVGPVERASIAAAEPEELAVAVEPAPIAAAELGELAVAEETPAVVYAPAPLEEAPVTGDGTAPVAEAAPVAPSEAAPPVRPRRPRAAKAKPAEVAPAMDTVEIATTEAGAAPGTPVAETSTEAGAAPGETPESEAPPPARGSKKAKPEPDVKQLSLF